eukprot:gene14000-10003_t
MGCDSTDKLRAPKKGEDSQAQEVPAIDTKRGDKVQLPAIRVSVDPRGCVTSADSSTYSPSYCASRLCDVDDRSRVAAVEAYLAAGCASSSIAVPSAASPDGGNSDSSSSSSGGAVGLSTALLLAASSFVAGAALGFLYQQQAARHFT